MLSRLLQSKKRKTETELNYQKTKRRTPLENSGICFPLDLIPLIRSFLCSLLDQMNLSSLCQSLRKSFDALLLDDALRGSYLVLLQQWNIQLFKESFNFIHFDNIKCIGIYDAVFRCRRLLERHLREIVLNSEYLIGEIYSRDSRFVLYHLKEQNISPFKTYTLNR
jgi:hypothetical protein